MLLWQHFCCTNRNGHLMQKKLVYIQHVFIRLRSLGKRIDVREEKKVCKYVRQKKENQILVYI